MSKNEGSEDLMPITNSNSSINIKYDYEVATKTTEEESNTILGDDPHMVL